MQCGYYSVLQLVYHVGTKVCHADISHADARQVKKKCWAMF